MAKLEKADRKGSQQHVR